MILTNKQLEKIKNSCKREEKRKVIEEIRKKVIKIRGIGQILPEANGDYIQRPRVLEILESFNPWGNDCWRKEETVEEIKKVVKGMKKEAHSHPFGKHEGEFCIYCEAIDNVLDAPNSKSGGK